MAFPTLLLALALARPVARPCPDVPSGAARIILGVGTQKVVTVPKLRATVRTRASEEGLDAKWIGADQVLLIGAKRGRFEISLFGADGERRFVVDVSASRGWSWSAPRPSSRASLVDQSAPP